MKQLVELGAYRPLNIDVEGEFLGFEESQSGCLRLGLYRAHFIICV